MEDGPNFCDLLSISEPAQKILVSQNKISEKVSKMSYQRPKNVGKGQIRPKIAKSQDVIYGCFLETFPLDTSI